MDSDEVSRALSIILEPANRPILIHCNKGKYRVGCIVGCLRKMQGWLHSIIFDEYARFAGIKVADQEVSAMRFPSTLYLHVLMFNVAHYDTSSLRRLTSVAFKSLQAATSASLRLAH